MYPKGLHALLRTGKTSGDGNMDQGTQFFFNGHNSKFYQVTTFHWTYCFQVNTLEKYINFRYVDRIKKPLQVVSLHHKLWVLLFSSNLRIVDSIINPFSLDSSIVLASRLPRSFAKNKAIQRCFKDGENLARLLWKINITTHPEIAIKLTEYGWTDVDFGIRTIPGIQIVSTETGRFFLCSQEYIDFVRLCQVSESVLHATPPSPDTSKWHRDWVGPAESLTLREINDALRLNLPICGNITLCQQGVAPFEGAPRRGYFFEELWTSGWKNIKRSPIAWEHFSPLADKSIQDIVAKEESRDVLWIPTKRIDREVISGILEGRLHKTNEHRIKRPAVTSPNSGPSKRRIRTCDHENVSSDKTGMETPEEKIIEPSVSQEKCTGEV